MPAEEPTAAEQHAEGRDRARLVISVYTAIDSEHYTAEELIKMSGSQGLDWLALLETAAQQGHLAPPDSPDAPALSNLRLSSAGKRALMQQIELYPDIQREVTPVQAIERSKL